MKTKHHQLQPVSWLSLELEALRFRQLYWNMADQGWCTHYQPHWQRFSKSFNWWQSLSEDQVSKGGTRAPDLSCQFVLFQYICFRMYLMNDLIFSLDCKLRSHCSPEASEWQLDTTVTHVPEHFPDRADCYFHCLGMWMSPHHPKSHCLCFCLYPPSSLTHTCTHIFLCLSVVKF